MTEEHPCRCAECQREMYVGSENKKPGLVGGRVPGLCNSCAQRIRHGIPTPGNDYECTECHKDVDTTYHKGGTQPSTGGMCLNCKRIVTLKKSLSAYLGSQCKGGCGYVLRGSKERARPGTRCHSKGGYCLTCGKIKDDAEVIAQEREKRERVALERQKAAAEMGGYLNMVKARKQREDQMKRSELALAYEEARRRHYQKSS